jgi:lipid-A-disaccharide synthase
MVAGEASGDLLAGLLLTAMRQRFPGMTAHGVGGIHMRAAGFRADWASERLAVRGYAEVVTRLPELLLLRKRLGDALIGSPPDAFIGVDAPDFNLALETRLRRNKIPVLHFVSPSLWAWRGERIDAIRRAVDHMLVLFPFEEKLYQDAGIEASYVGHPLADVIALEPDRQAARTALGQVVDAPLVALLPGSRLAEIRYNGPVFLEAAALLKAERPELRFLVPMASPQARLAFDAVLKASRLSLNDVLVIEHGTHQVLGAANAALVASGTATLEAALFKCPMVVAYRMAALSYAMMKNKGYLPWVALPNILAREFLVPEFLQSEATPKALADALSFQLDDPANRERLKQRFTEMHLQLRCNTGERSANAIAQFLDRHRRP